MKLCPVHHSSIVMIGRVRRPTEHRRVSFCRILPRIAHNLKQRRIPNSGVSLLAAVQFSLDNLPFLSKAIRSLRTENHNFGPAPARPRKSAK
jgi:hypothetical protein